MQCECDAAVAAILVAVTVACVEDIFDILGREGDQAESVSEEFVGENGRVGFDFNKVNGHGGYFGKDCATDGVCKSEVDG